MILDLLKSRRSVRKYSDKKITREQIDYILEAGRLSPSGGNEQPWKFGVITDKALIKEIAKTAYNQKWIAGAQFLIVLCIRVISDREGGRNIQTSRFPDLKEEINNLDKKLYTRLNMEEHQTKIPGTHMVLAAQEQGIGSTWISYFKVDKVATLLGLPQNYLPSEIIAFGYPVQDTSRTSKKDREELVFFNDELFNEGNDLNKK